ncbi:thiamine-binding protein [[Clostridium] colinum]|uniref:thiamine-binding protein n=1 Tax=[Clostridium] colinum TaxID=36835 RepID=UPI0020241663|nr:thiamine-binding protein [[Clostridium] colinum]
MKKCYEASMAIQILPNLQEKEEKIKVIDKVIENIKNKGLNMVVCPFETVVEGKLDEILGILKESILIAEKEGAKDILTYIKIAYNPLGVMSIDEKISKHNK